jgi:hypothetical protein
MLKDNGLIGVFSLYRQVVRPFTDKQIALVANFATHREPTANCSDVHAAQLQSRETCTGKFLDAVRQAVEELSRVCTRRLNRRHCVIY